MTSNHELEPGDHRAVGVDLRRPPREDSVMDLIEFLLARISEDEKDARLALDGPDFNEATVEARQKFARPGVGGYDPARVLAECEAKRRIVESYNSPDSVGSYGDGLWEALAHLALPYADHPDYREEWRP